MFISHGTQDAVLPNNNTSRLIAQRQKDAGYNLMYREFEWSNQLLHRIDLEAFACVRGRRNGVERACGEPGSAAEPRDAKGTEAPHTRRSTRWAGLEPGGLELAHPSTSTSCADESLSVGIDALLARGR